jgi:hypothetical protein
MSALDVSAVVALTNKATTLHEKGAYARAAELYARAAAAARALGARDCLVVAALQIMQADCWVLQSFSPLLGAAEKAGMSGAAIDLLPATLATLARRRKAGTLLPGTCAPHEEAWELACATHDTMMNAMDPTSDDFVEVLPALAQFVGYIAYLDGARLALMRATLLKAVADTRDDEAWALATALACDAMELMTQPRTALDALGLQACHMPSETSFASGVQQDIAHGFISDADDFGRTLLAAWARVERSGVLQTRHMLHGISLGVARNNEQREAMTAASTVPNALRRCALNSCVAREVHVSQFKLCGACKTAVYCSKEHQAAHWRDHKAACKATRSGGAGGAAPSDER